MIGGTLFQSVYKDVVALLVYLHSVPEDLQQPGGSRRRRVVIVLHFAGVVLGNQRLRETEVRQLVEIVLYGDSQVGTALQDLLIFGHLRSSVFDHRYYSTALSMVRLTKVVSPLWAWYLMALSVRVENHSYSEGKVIINEPECPNMAENDHKIKKANV